MDDPEIRSLGEITLLGFGSRFTSVLSPDADNFTVIPHLWEQFNQRDGEITSRAGDGCYGACIPLADGKDDEFFYVAGVPVTEDAPIPEGMEKHTIPAGTYAVFEHHGPVSGIGATMQEIYGEWFPTSGMRRSNGPDLEYYDERFTDGEDSVMEVWVPLASGEEQEEHDASTINGATGPGTPQV